MALRARMVLAAAQGHANAQIARELNVNVDTVRLWRDRWVGLQGIDLETLSIAERLQDHLLQLIGRGLAKREKERRIFFKPVVLKEKKETSPCHMIPLVKEICQH